MCDPSNPNYQPDWAEWGKKSRTELQAAAAALVVGSGAPAAAAAVADEFDTTISGPWMTAWPITHHNRHTRALGIKKS